MRYFEKISKEQYEKDVHNNNYELFSLPKRSTTNSAGYDFYSPVDLILKPNDVIKIPTGVKVNMNEDEVLLVVVRSSMGFKYNVRMCNQVGVIDKDYYNNIDNEGHMWVALENHGDKDYEIKVNDRICQGIFTKFLTVDNEDKINKERIGGIGSTTIEENE